MRGRQIVRNALESTVGNRSSSRWPLSGSERFMVGAGLLEGPDCASTGSVGQELLQPVSAPRVGNTVSLRSQDRADTNGIILVRGYPLCCRYAARERPEGWTNGGEMRYIQTADLIILAMEPIILFRRKLLLHDSFAMISWMIS